MRWVTWQQIRSIQFTTRRWRGGYDIDEVDEFLDDLEQTVGEQDDYIAELEAERDWLRAQLEQQRRRRWPAPVTRPDLPPVDPQGRREPVSSTFAMYAPLRELAAQDVPRPEGDSSAHSGDLAVRGGFDSPAASGAGPGHPSIGDEAQTYLARHVETHEEWTARTDLELARWHASRDERIDQMVAQLLGVPA